MLTLPRWNKIVVAKAEGNRKKNGVTDWRKARWKCGETEGENESERKQQETINWLALRHFSGLTRASKLSSSFFIISLYVFSKLYRKHGRKQLVSLRFCSLHFYFISLRFLFTRSLIASASPLCSDLLIFFTLFIYSNYCRIFLALESSVFSSVWPSQLRCELCRAYTFISVERNAHAQTWNRSGV